MIIDEEVYLKHFGVKGMHWGVRHDPKRSRSTARTVRKVARGAAVAGSVGLAAVSVYSLIKHYQAIRLLQIHQLRTTTSNIKAAQDYVNAHKLVKTSTFRKGFQVSKSGVADPIYRTVRAARG